MSNLFYFVRDRLTVDDFEKLAAEHKFQFLPTGAQYTLMLTDDRGMPSAMASMELVDGVFQSYMTDKKKSDYPLINFIQDELKMPVVAALGRKRVNNEGVEFKDMKFGEKVVAYNRLVKEIAEGREDLKDTVLHLELEEFVTNFKGTQTTYTPSGGKRIKDSKERKKSL